MAKQLPPQVQSALLWIKANVLVVVFCAIVVLVPVGAYFAAGTFNGKVDAEAKKRVQVYNDLDAASKAKVSLPLPGGEPFPLAGLPNEEVVHEYEQILAKVSDDAKAVYGTALTFNGGSANSPKHAPAVELSVFPGYNRGNRSERESVRLKVGEAIRRDYEKLLSACRTGTPPDPASMVASIEAAEKRFVQGELKQESRAKLSPAQVELLDKHLGKSRIEQYFEVAKKISFYVDRGAFPIPTKESVNQLLQPAKDDAALAKALDQQDKKLFELQWTQWVTADILRAFAAANGPTLSVVQAPVKRVVSIRVLPLGAAAGDASGGESSGGEAPAAETPAPAEGSAPAADSGATVPSTKLGVPVVDPKADAPRDFSKRFTGRQSNAVYDVRLAEVTFVAETTKLPKILDALAAQNLVTVANVRVAAADPFAAAREGYLYGVEPVSTVTATVESVWLREWIAVYMPAATRAELRIQSASADGATPPPTGM